MHQKFLREIAEMRAFCRPKDTSEKQGQGD